MLRMAWTDRKAKNAVPPGFVTRRASERAVRTSVGSYRCYMGPRTRVRSNSPSENRFKSNASP